MASIDQLDLKPDIHDIFVEEDTFKVTENEIRITFNMLRAKLDSRRDQLLTQLQEFKRRCREHGEYLKRRIEETKNVISEMTESNTKIKLTSAKNLQRMAINKLNEKVKFLEKDLIPPKYELKIDISKFEDYISLTGHLISSRQFPCRDYTQIKPTSAFGKYGTGPGEFDERLYNIVYDEINDRVFISDTNKRLTVWTMDGEYVQDVGTEFARFTPFGIALNSDSLFVSGFMSNIVYKFNLANFKLVGASGVLEPELFDFSEPSGIVLNTPELFVAERLKRRISVYDFNLHLSRIINFNIDTSILDFKIKDDIIYILHHVTNAIHLFSLTGREIAQLPAPDNALLTHPFYFCIDGWNNILITDREQDILRVVSCEGKLLASVNTREAWGLVNPRGVTVTRDGRVLLVVGGRDKPCFTIL